MYTESLMVYLRQGQRQRYLQSWLVLIDAHGEKIWLLNTPSDPASWFNFDYVNVS